MWLGDAGEAGLRFLTCVAGMLQEYPRPAFTIFFPAGYELTFLAALLWSILWLILLILKVLSLSTFK